VLPVDREGFNMQENSNAFAGDADRNGLPKPEFLSRRGAVGRPSSIPAELLGVRLAPAVFAVVAVVRAMSKEYMIVIDARYAVREVADTDDMSAGREVDDQVKDYVLPLEDVESAKSAVNSEKT